MRTLIPLLILFVLGYVAWSAWERFTARPLQTELLRLAGPDLEEIIVTEDDRRFRFFRAEDRWVVARDNQEIYDQSAAVEELVTVLSDIRTDSVLRRAQGEALFDVQLLAAGANERFALHFPAAGPPHARLLATGDVFALPPPVGPVLQRSLRFATYRGDRTLQIAAARVDSIVMERNDSLRLRPDPDRLRLLSHLLLAPAPAPNAPYFDEVADREKQYATLSVFADGTPHRITAYRDSAWPKPFVIIGEDFPLRPFALDSIW